MQPTPSSVAERKLPGSRLPRLGFLGAGWIGLQRLQIVAHSGVAEIAAIADPSPLALRQAAEAEPGAAVFDSFESLLEEDLDGVVIATPNALHAEQTIAALGQGLSVCCQKPLARTADETSRVLEAAHRADCLLGVDLSYRDVKGVAEMRELVRGGPLGKVYAAELVFHNAYGPDKDWFYDPARSGGGCVIDLGTHLVDLALWVFDYATPSRVSSRLYAKGLPLTDSSLHVEDYALAQLEFETGTVARLACSWNASAGREAVIEAAFYGTAGGVALRNVHGSFYDFTVEVFHGTRSETIASGPDAWGGRAIVRWARQLARRPNYDSAADHFLDTAKVLDAIYGR